MSDVGSSSSDESLDIKSDKFDPLKALYSSKIRVPLTNVKVYDNISKYEAVSKGLSFNVVPGRVSGLEFGFNIYITIDPSMQYIYIYLFIIIDFLIRPPAKPPLRRHFQESKKKNAEPEHQRRRFLPHQGKRNVITTRDSIISEVRTTRGRYIRVDTLDGGGSICIVDEKETVIKQRRYPMI